ncbi:MAG: hypothetical protein H5T84_05590 [Thermoleophilia bacterium]|nr:hypothetical protein [Thermoleophilia bacterium]
MDNLLELVARGGAKGCLDAVAVKIDLPFLPGPGISDKLVEAGRAELYQKYARRT